MLSRKVINSDNWSPLPLCEKSKSNSDHIIIEKALVTPQKNRSVIAFPSLDNHRGSGLASRTDPSRSRYVTWIKRGRQHTTQRTDFRRFCVLHVYYNMCISCACMCLLGMLNYGTLSIRERRAYHRRWKILVSKKGDDVLCERLCFRFHCLLPARS